MRDVAVVLGVPIDDLTMTETVERIGQMVRVGRTTGRTHQVATVNVDFLVNAVTDRDVLAILQDADLNIPDGMPVVWAARLFGRRLRGRVAGADLVPALVECSAHEGFTVYLYGAAPGIAEQAAERLQTRYVGARVTGRGGSFFEAVEDVDPGDLEAIRTERPDILCVALGNPKQERWIAAHRGQLGVPVLIGVGGTLDFIVGEKKRSPAWMQRLGLEWLFRALSEPRRLAKRYARDLLHFAPRVLVDIPRMRRRGTSAGAATVVRHGGSTVVHTHGFLDLRRQLLTRESLDQLEDSRTVCVDLTDTTRIDQATAASLFALDDVARRSGGRLALLGPSRRLVRDLRRLRLDEHFGPRPRPAERNDTCGTL